MHFVMMMKKGMDIVQTGEVVIDPRTEGSIVDGLQVLLAEGGRGVAQTTAEAGRGVAQTMARVVTEEALIMAVVQARMAAKVMRGAAPTMIVNVAKLVLDMTGPAATRLQGKTGLESVSCLRPTHLLQTNGRTYVVMLK